MPSDKVYLSKVIENKSQQETRDILRGYYTDWYRSGDYDPPNSRNTWDATLKEIPTFIRALDIGCGPGYGVRKARRRGQLAYGIDFFDNLKVWQDLGVDDYCFQAEAAYLPFKDNTFDLIVCGDVLEHIPEFDVDKVLSEAARVGAQKFIFLICLVHEGTPVMDKYYSHITIKSIEYWVNKLYDNGIRPMNAETYSYKDDHVSYQLLVRGVKDYVKQLRKGIHYGTTRCS